MRLMVVFILSMLTVFADFSYDSTSRVTGGTLLKMASMPIPGMGEARKALEPVVSRVSIKGDRMITKSADTATITDLSKETITTIDYREKTYSVVTFAQMKELMETVVSQSKQPIAPASGSWEFDVQPTGRTQKIDGFDCREVILTMKATAKDEKSGQSGQFVMNNLMWIAKSVPGDQELKAFNLKMAEKMKIDPKSIGQISLGGFGKGMAELQAKAKELDGVTIVQVTTVSMNAEGLPKSIDIPENTEALRQMDEARAQQQKQQTAAQNEAIKAEAADAVVASGTEAGQVATRDALGGGKYGNIAAGALGRFGGLGRKKQKAEAAPKPPPAAQPAENSKGSQTAELDGVMMQLRITETGFSNSSVDASIFDVPAGLREVPHPMSKLKK